MNNVDAFNLLVDKAGVPKLATSGKRSRRPKVLRHQNLAGITADTVVKTISLARSIGDNTLTQAQLKDLVYKEVRAEYSLVTTLLWLWRIYSWVQTLWEAYNVDD